MLTRVEAYVPLEIEGVGRKGRAKLTVDDDDGRIEISALSVKGAEEILKAFGSGKNVEIQVLVIEEE